MIEKVKLTRGQAEAIEWLRKVHHDSEIVARNAVLRERRGEKEDSRQEDGRHRKLFKIGLHELIKALYIGYEVEETFKVGDWVVDRGSVYKIISKHHADDLNKGVYPEARHATPEEIAKEKQRRWWARHGRDVWELKENDLLYYDDGFKEVEEVSEIGAIMLSSERVYTPIETIKNKYSVACFAEDRKDLEV